MLKYDITWKTRRKKQREVHEVVMGQVRELVQRHICWYHIGQKFWHKLSLRLRVCQPVSFKLGEVFRSKHIGKVRRTFQDDQNQNMIKIKREIFTH